MYARVRNLVLVHHIKPSMRLVIGIVLLSAAALARAQMPELERVGPRVGAAAPEFSGADQFGKAQTLQSVMGPQGVMLVFFRSADW
jgi:hypothetical protein